jgi:hypothetical protein
MSRIDLDPVRRGLVALLLVACGGANTDSTNEPAGEPASDPGAGLPTGAGEPPLGTAPVSTSMPDGTPDGTGAAGVTLKLPDALVPQVLLFLSDSRTFSDNTDLLPSTGWIRGGYPGNVETDWYPHVDGVTAAVAKSRRVHVGVQNWSNYGTAARKRDDCGVDAKLPLAKGRTGVASISDMQRTNTTCTAPYMTSTFVAFDHNWGTSFPFLACTVGFGASARTCGEAAEINTAAGWPWRALAPERLDALKAGSTGVTMIAYAGWRTSYLIYDGSGANLDLPRGPAAEAAIEKIVAKKHGLFWVGEYGTCATSKIMPTEYGNPQEITTAGQTARRLTTYTKHRGGFAKLSCGLPQLTNSLAQQIVAQTPLTLKVPESAKWSSLRINGVVLPGAKLTKDKDMLIVAAEDVPVDFDIATATLQLLE